MVEDKETVLFDGVKVFSATKARERGDLGEVVTRWISDHPECRMVDKEATLTSDAEFHCLTITIFYRETG